MLNPASVPPEFLQRVAPFLQAHGFAGDCAIEPVAGGGNNRVYRVPAAARAGLLKAYFQNPAVFDALIRASINSPKEP